MTAVELSRSVQVSVFHVRQRCAGCGLVYDGHDPQLHCSSCERTTPLVSEYQEPLALRGDARNFPSYAPWLPYRNVLGIPGPQTACVRGGLADLVHDFGGFPYSRSVTVDLHDDEPALIPIENYLAAVDLITRSVEGVA